MLEFVDQSLEKGPFIFAHAIAGFPDACAVIIEEEKNDNAVVVHLGEPALPLIQNILVKALRRIGTDKRIVSGSTEIRRKSWAAAMGGAYVMIYQMYIDDTAVSDLQDCGRLVRFFESTDFNTMSPHDDLKYGDTDYVLANPGCSYIVYASGTTTTIGLKNMTSGIYSFKWFDCKDGDTVQQSNVSVSSGDQRWNKPSGLGGEIAVYITTAASPL